MANSFKSYALTTLAGVSLFSVAPRAAASPEVEAAEIVPAQRTELATFRYGHFANRAWELGLPRQALGFTVKVGADGKITECAFDRKFRSAFTPKELCDHLRQSMTFRPARDAAGGAVGDVYSNRVEIASLIIPPGYRPR